MSASTKRRRDEHPGRGCQCPVHVARRAYQREWWRQHPTTPRETAAERDIREARELAIARGERPASDWNAA